MRTRAVTRIVSLVGVVSSLSCAAPQGKPTPEPVVPNAAASSATGVREASAQTGPNPAGRSTARFDVNWPRGEIGWVKVIKRRGTADQVIEGEATWNIVVGHSPEGRFTVSWRPRPGGPEAEAFQLAMYLPELTVSTDGTTIIAPGQSAAFVQRVAAYSQKPMSATALEAAALVTEQSFIQTWSAAFTSWAGTEVLLDQETRVVVNFVLVPGMDPVPVTEWMLARGSTPCSGASHGPSCVSISLRHEISADDSKSMVQELPSALGGKPFSEDEKKGIQMPRMSSKSYVLIDPSRTLPYKVVRDNSAVVQFEGNETPVSTYEEWEFHYTFPEQ